MRRTIDIGIYLCEVQVIVCDVMADGVRSLPKVLQRTLDDDIGLCMSSGLTIEDPRLEHNRIYVVIVYEGSSNIYSICSHEAFHATDKILGSRGIELTRDTGEVFAYLVGYITKGILEVCAKYSKVKDGGSDE